MRKIEILRLTTNSMLFKRVYRILLESYGKGSGIRCARCAPHKGCNRQSNAKDRTWKKYRKCQQKWIASRQSIRELHILDWDDEEVD